MLRAAHKNVRGASASLPKNTTQFSESAPLEPAACCIHSKIYPCVFQGKTTQITYRSYGTYEIYKLVQAYIHFQKNFICFFIFTWVSQVPQVHL